MSTMPFWRFAIEHMYKHQINSLFQIVSLLKQFERITIWCSFHHYAHLAGLLIHMRANLGSTILLE